MLAGRGVVGEGWVGSARVLCLLVGGIEGSAVESTWVIESIWSVQGIYVRVLCTLVSPVLPALLD